jgi:hypothetical protein
LDTGVTPAQTIFEITVVGPPDNMTLAVAPAVVACDGAASAEVSATVSDAEGNPVANGTRVRFDVQVLGLANPITATTTDGVAKSTITPLAASDTGVPVVVSSGISRDGGIFSTTTTGSALVACGPGGAPAPGAPAPGGGAAPGGGPPTGTVRPPDTGSGGDLDGRGALNVWMAVGLFAGAMALVGARLALRRI